MTYTNAHKMVANLAEQFANEVYDYMATVSNDWYKSHKNRRKWVRFHLLNHGDEYVKEARKILGSMCGPDSNLPDSEKNKIVEALSMDAAIRGAYQSQTTVN